MCHLAGVSRAGYYRHWKVKAPAEEEMAVRAAIQEVALGHRNYGRPRITRVLRRRGMVVNHKRVGRIMREDNLLSIRRRRYILTTDSRHDQPVFLNIAARMTLSGIDQLWVADITYIRLRTEFVYLAIVLDKYSRKAVGWAVDRRLTTDVVLRALQQAVAARQPAAGLVHHSDRGVQYSSREYAAALQANGVIASMSRPANPYDNAACESFMKTLKQEEIHCHQYRDFEDLEKHLKEFIDGYYNQVRLHSALGYRTPEEFERETSPGPNYGAGAIRPFLPPSEAGPPPEPSESPS